MNQQKLLFGKTVLVIEDNAFFADVIGQVLQLEQVQPYFAVNREEALAQLAAHTVDVVLCDYNLPNISGTELLREINSLCSVPIVLISGEKPEVLDTLLAEQIISAFVSKPFTRAAIIASLQHAIEP